MVKSQSGDSARKIKKMGGKKMADDNSYVYICLYEFMTYIYIGRIQPGEKKVMSCDVCMLF